MTPVYLGLGSNIQNPVEQLNQALKSLKSLVDSRFVASSPFYQSKPQGPQDQPDFMNAVVLIETTLKPQPLLVHLQALELKQGRVKSRHWGERCIDIDILLYGNLVLNFPDLVIPHPQMTQRDFVMLPFLVLYWSMAR